MKKNTNSNVVRQVLSLTGIFGLSVLLLLSGLTATVTTGCQKARLFTHVDTLQGVPSQFHFFNAFSYDSALNFSVDGVLREKVQLYHFSNYYPTASAFNQDPTQPNGKYILVSDPQLQTEFYTFNTLQFTPATSYLVFPLFFSYDTARTPLNTIVPSLSFYPEDVETPFDGGARVRLLDLLADDGSMSMSITPNAGAGTTLNLQSLFLGGPTQPVTQPKNVTTTYTGTQVGTKNISVTIGDGNITTKFTYLPVTLDNRNYSFFMVGDIKNFLNGIQPRPRLFLSPDGDPTHMQELTLSSISYPGNFGTQALVNVINDAYNVPGLLNFGNISIPGQGTQYVGLDLDFNQTPINVWRWTMSQASGVWEEGTRTPYDPLNPSANVYSRTNSSFVLPGAYSVNVVPGGGFAPVYSQFNCNLEAGLSYSVCLLPDNTTANRCSSLILQNDNAPNSQQFRLRVINLLGGSTQVDVHTGSPSGPLLAAAVPYAQATDYINLAPNTQPQNLYVTAVGSTDPLFQTGTDNGPIALSYIGGNSGTLYIMGLLPGTPYNGDSNYFGPYVIFWSDASINPNTTEASQQLYY